MFGVVGPQVQQGRVRKMQLFHELKQQFPTVPDHVVTSCLSAAAPPPMGRPRTPRPITTTPPAAAPMAEQPPQPQAQPKRPDSLPLRSEAPPLLRTSEKCRDVFRLLNDDKPPRSPQRQRRHAPTVSTPTQTTDTLVQSPAGVNLTLNVNVQTSPPAVQVSPNKRTATVQLTPAQPWLPPEVGSPRSFTSVNLTLRPPADGPQAPIDITSRNSSLTYSTSSFDSQRGLQSRLQITVGPGGGGTVSSVRARPRSYHPECGGALADAAPPPAHRAGSLNNLVDNDKPPVILQQEARIERLRIELKTEKAKLEIKQRDYDTECAKKRERDLVNRELRKQLENEVNHLRYQCKQLNNYEDQEFYERGQSARPLLFLPTNGGAQWNCSMCTFLNHPDLSKCEQCDMPKTVHGTQTQAQPLQIPNDLRRMFDTLCQNGQASDTVLERLSTRNDNELFGPHLIDARPLSEDDTTR